MAETRQQSDVRRMEEGLRGVQDSVEKLSRGLELNCKSVEDLRQILESHIRFSCSATQAPANGNREAGSSQSVRANSGGHYQVATRLSRIDFPRFEGEDVEGLLYRIRQFFEIDDTPEELKVKLVAVHLGGRALQWHQSYMMNRREEEISWEQYVHAMKIRFGEAAYEDPMAELTKLRQLGSVRDYQDRFDVLLSRIELSDKHAVSCFLSGLREEIQMAMRMFKP